MCDGKEMRELGWKEKDNLPGVYVPISNPHQELFKKIDGLLKRFEVPPSLRADWEGTNHFELTYEHGRLWLELREVAYLFVKGQYETDEEYQQRWCNGIPNLQRLGYCLEAAALLVEIGRAMKGEKI
jgi:hypothetical protein